MQFRSIVIGVALATLSATSLYAEIRIRNDPGGIISEHMNVFAQLRDRGETVVIDGRCLSACTLVLGMLPPDRICVTSRASLGFHAAWVPGDNGRPVHSEYGTQAMWSVYPDNIRRWIRSKGGLSRKMITLTGRELASMYRVCQ
jgi:hypothetical protein